MSDAADGPGGLQFDKVEAAAPAPAVCHACASALSGEYYQVDGRLTCASCKDKMVAATSAPIGKSALLRGFAYGAGAAVGGSVLWFAVAKLTGLEIGFIGILIGALVGRAVRKGAGQRGGRGPQLIAVVLTYLSIVSSYVPDVAKAMLDGASKQSAAQSTPSSTETSASPNPSSPPAPSSPTPSAPMNAFVALALFLGLCLAVAIAAPFLAGASNIMGILIIGFALWEAFRVNRATTPLVVGPLEIAPPASPLAVP